MLNKVSDSYKHHIPSIVFGPTLKIIEAVFDLLMPLIMKAIIDLSRYGEPKDIPNALSQTLAYFIRSFNAPKDSISDALVGGGIILAMGIVGFIITMISQYLAARTSSEIGYEVRDSLYEKILLLSKKEREKLGSSRILNAINSDTYQLQNGALLLLRLVVRAPFILLGALIFSFILDWRVGLAYVAIIPLIVLVNVVVLRKASKEYIKIQQDLDSISNKTSETILGARVIKASNLEEYENDKFSIQTKEYENKTRKVNKLNSFINPLTFAITSLVLIVIIFLLNNELFNPNENILISSTIIAEMSYLALIFFVTVQLTQTAVELVKAYVSIKRIDEILLLKPEIIDNHKEAEGGDSAPLIRFNNVYFSFLNNDKYFLKDLSFEIRKGETFGIIGGTGSGKSTIASLLERYYDVSRGEILYKGKDIRDISLSTLRNNISIVNQKTSLFKGTIKSNYLMAKPNASDEEIINALKEAEAYEFVSKYDDGILHKVEEGGTNFSGGQRQRLCIGRALIRNSELLILDDSTSALDLLTDKRIRNNLEHKKDITKIIISQRISTIQHSDYILVIDGGEVVGLGKHEELLKSCPIYHEIYVSQIKKD